MCMENNLQEIITVVNFSIFFSISQYKTFDLVGTAQNNQFNTNSNKKRNVGDIECIVSNSEKGF